MRNVNYRNRNNRIVIQFIFISTLFLFSSCDIIDSAIGGGPTEPNDTKAIDRIEVKFLIDNAKSVIDYFNNPNPSDNTHRTDNFTGVEFGADITSMAGTSRYDDERKAYFTDFTNPEVLGQTIRGLMNVYFFEDPRKVNIYISQTRSHTSSVFGSVVQFYNLKYDGIPYSQSYTDSFTDLKVVEYYISKPSVNSTTTNFAENNDIYTDRTEPTVSGNRAYIKVKVHYK